MKRNNYKKTGIQYLIIIVLSLLFIADVSSAGNIEFTTWNKYSTRFVNAPEYKWKPIENAVKYRIGVASVHQEKAAWFETTETEFNFEKIWLSLPMGR